MTVPYLDLECSASITRLLPGCFYVLRVPGGKDWDEGRRSALEARIHAALGRVSWGPEGRPVVIVESDEVSILDLTEKVRAQGALL